MFTLLGCETPIVLEDPPVLFCDVEEQRKFSQEELDWRSDNAPWNLRRDFKTNVTWDRECTIDNAVQDDPLVE